MTFRSSTIVFALACLSLGAVVYCQSAGMNALRLPNVPQDAELASYETLSQTQIPGMDRRVTAKFQQVGIGKVLAWLSDEKLSFVVDESDFPGTKITLNFEEARLSEVLDAIAATLNAHWQRRGEVFTLKPTSGRIRGSVTVPPLTPAPKVSPKAEDSKSGRTWTLPMTGIEDKGDIWERIEIQEKDGKVRAFRYDPKTKSMKELSESELKALQKNGLQFAIPKIDLKGLRALPPIPNLHTLPNDRKAYKLDQKTGKLVPLTEAEKAEMERMWKEWGEKFGKEMELWGESYGKQWEQWAKEFEQKFGSGDGMKSFKFVIPPMEFKGLEQLKELPFGIEGLKELPLTEYQRKELEKALKDARSTIEVWGTDHDSRMKALEKSLKAREKALSDSERKRIQEMLKGLDGRQPFVRLHEGPMLHSGNIEKLIESLSAEQKQLHGKQGHLLWSQLTPEQQKMLGGSPGGNFSLSFTVNGKSISIKSGE